MRQIIIGKEGNQPFAITDSYVSRRHAILSYDEATRIMTLTDNKSSNGTYVNLGGVFQRIEQCRVDANTVVRLGPNFTFMIGQLLKSQGGGGGVSKPPQKKPEKVDISHLRWVAENYETTKLKLERKQATINSLRMLTIAGSLIGSVIGAALPRILNEEGNPLYSAIGPVVAIVFLIGLLLYCGKAGREVIVKKNQNEKEYKISYCCPKCHAPLAGQVFENVLAAGKCPKCKTEYYVKNN